MLPPGVWIKCATCGNETYRSAGVVVRALGRPLTDHTAAMVPQAIGCLECGSHEVSVFVAPQKSKIVVAGKSRRCRVCDGFISERFRRSFPKAHFCSLCVSEGRVADEDVVAAFGEAAPGQAYRTMASVFWGDKAQQLHWLRKAAKTGNANALYRLAGILTESNDPADLAECFSAYSRAAMATASKELEFKVCYAEHAVAVRLLWGRGCTRDVGRAIEMMRSAGAKGATRAMRGLGRLFLDGKLVERNLDESYACYRKAYDLSPDDFGDSAAIAFFLLLGIGTEPDEAEGVKVLGHSISKYAAMHDDVWGQRPRFDQDGCLREILVACRVAEGRSAMLPLARRYLHWMAYLRVPQADHLLDRCGGPLPPYQPRWELRLSRCPPEKVKADTWWVQSPVPRSASLTMLGQVEQLPNRVWIATTDAGVPVGETFGSMKDAVVALAAAVGCYVPYVDPLAKRLKRRGMDAPP
ncbi:MAG: sel1 repeat family protein [Planctomycetes bacterium]|nr:sel1 repeat family protein [Planctomycetota bacterium]